MSDAEAYIEQYGATLTEAEKRYIRAFGAPAGFHAGAARNPYTPGLQVRDAQEQADEEHRTHMRDLDDEASRY